LHDGRAAPKVVGKGHPDGGSLRRGSVARRGGSSGWICRTFLRSCVRFFAVTQISHHLVYHCDLRGAVEAGLLFFAIWWVWVCTTWFLNRLDPEHATVRALLFVLMALGLYASMAIATAFGDRGLVFAEPLRCWHLAFR